VQHEKAESRRVKRDWEIIADNLSKAGWNCGCISTMDDEGRQFCVAAGEREDAGRFIVRAAEKLTAFLELESAIHHATGCESRKAVKSASLTSVLRNSAWGV
jgi:hypothetical protein